MSGESALSAVYAEATSMLDREEMKSIATRDLLILQIRAMEATLFGEVRTPLRPRHTP